MPKLAYAIGLVARGPATLEQRWSGVLALTNPALICALRSDLGVTAAGGTASAIADLSGNGMNGTWAASQPAVVTANGRQTLRFSSASVYPMDFASGAFAALTSAHAFFVFKNATDPPVGSGLHMLGTGAGSAIPYSDGNIYDSFGTDTRKTHGSTGGATANLCCYDVYSAANKWNNFLNGSARGAEITTNTVAFPAGTTRLFWDVGFAFEGDFNLFLLFANTGGSIPTGHLAVVNAFMTMAYGASVKCARA